MTILPAASLIIVKCRSEKDDIQVTMCNVTDGFWQMHEAGGFIT